VATNAFELGHGGHAEGIRNHTRPVAYAMSAPSRSKPLLSDPVGPEQVSRGS
jgi:hypothetical protein